MTTSTTQDSTVAAIAADGTTTVLAQVRHIDVAEPTPGEEFAHVDPRTLVVGANARSDADLTPAFVASVRQHGVLQTIDAQRDQDGNLVVLRGQRRTLAAVQTEQATVPVRILPSVSDEARRVIEQVVENDHRAAMRDAHRTAAVRQLSLDFGLSAAAIAKSLGATKKTVATTLAVAESKVASAVQAKYDLTLDQAAVVAEFDDDSDAVKELTALAVKNPDAFDHAAQRLRDQREEAAQIAALRADLAERGVTEVDKPAHGDTKARDLTDLKANTEATSSEPLTVEGHATCPGHAAYVANSTWADPRIVYVCTDYQSHGHVDRWPVYSASGSARPAGPMSEAEKAERREVVANNKAWKSAETVRRQWLAKFAARKNAPKGAFAFVGTALSIGMHALSKAAEQTSHRYAAELLGHTGPVGGRDHISDLIEKANPGRADLITLVVVLGAIEDSTGTHTWRNPGGIAGAYLNALATWGYTLSDVEKIAAGVSD